MIKILSLSPFHSRLPIKCKLYIYNGIIANKQIGVRGKDATLKQTWESWKLIQGEYFVIVFKVSQNNFKELVKENEGTREMVQPGKHLPRLQSSCVWTYSTYVRKDECNILCLSFRYGGGIENHAFLELAGHLAYTSWVLGPVESTVSKNKWLRELERCSPVKSIYCRCRELGFSFQHLHGSSPQYQDIWYILVASVCSRDRYGAHI